MSCQYFSDGIHEIRHIPKSPVGDFPFNSYAIDHLQHPKVIQINIELRPPSPVLVPKDKDQPFAGQICKDIGKANPNAISNFVVSNNKTEISLDLRKSKLLTRRAKC